MCTFLYSDLKQSSNLFLTILNKRRGKKKIHNQFKLPKLSFTKGFGSFFSQKSEFAFILLTSLLSALSAYETNTKQ